MTIWPASFHIGQGAEQDFFWVETRQLEQGDVNAAAVWLYRKASFWHALQNTSGILLLRPLERGTASCFLWTTVTWVPAAKHAYFCMVCCSPAQSHVWHAGTANDNANSRFLLLGYGCTAETHNEVQDGTSSNPSQALLVPFQTAGWAKCHLVWGFA